MNVARWIIAALAALVGSWCLVWLIVLVALGFFATTRPALADYLILAAWVLASFVAACVIQPWRPAAGRQRGERI